MNVVEEIKNLIVSPSFSSPSQNTLSLHFKLGDNYPACSSHSPAGSLLPLKDWIQACHPALGRQQTQRPPLCTSKEC